jgi:hypothetical protein
MVRSAYRLTATPGRLRQRRRFPCKAHGPATLRTLRVSRAGSELSRDGSEVQNGYISSYFGLIAAPEAELLILRICTAFGAFRVLALTVFLRLALTYKQEVARSSRAPPTASLQDFWIVLLRRRAAGVRNSCIPTGFC